MWVLVITRDNTRFRIENIYSSFWRFCQMHADGKSTLASVSKWNSRKVNSIVSHFYTFAVVANILLRQAGLSML